MKGKECSVDRYLDLVNVGVALLAIVLSLYAVLRAGRQQRRDAFFRIQEMLLTPDLMAGRRTLYESKRAGYLPADEARFEQAQRAIAAMNTAGILIRHEVVPEKWFIDAWHTNLKDLRVGFDSVVAYRIELQEWFSWPDLERLISQAEHHRCPPGCCSPGSADVPTTGQVLRRENRQSLIPATRKEDAPTD